MNLYTTDQKLLFSSNHTSLKETIEAAINDNTPLDHVDLKDQDLRNINMDGALLRYARFQNADLTGANMSEALLDGSNFSYAHMYNTCVAYSSLQYVDFLETEFGATDLSQSNISDSIFSGPSCHSLTFRHVRTMKGSKYLYQKKLYDMQRPPTFIRCEAGDIVIFDDYILKEGQMIKKDNAQKSPITPIEERLISGHTRV